jgi:hypothetical protein
VLRRLGRLFDRIEALWEGERTRRIVASLLVAVFVAMVVAIELGRRGVLPARLAGTLPDNHFRAVELAFYLLLAWEVVGLVFSLARSVTAAAGKQFEIFSLILLRHSFEEFGHLDEPVTWEGAREAVVRMIANGFGALALFVVLGFYYAAQRHAPLSDDARDTQGFVAAKKALALLLLVVFAALAGRTLLFGHREFFESFYTVLVFADVLVVLVSLRYSTRYAVVFRNSGLAVATVLLRVALSAPAFYNAALGLAAALFALGLTLAANRFDPVLRRVPEREAGPIGAAGS